MNERRAIRTAAGVSQAELAEALNVTAVTVLRWERGTCSPRGEALTAYARLLDQLKAIGGDAS